MYEDLNTYDRVYLIYCDINNYRHWIKECTSPEKFFSNYDKLIAALKELTTINYEYLSPTPSEELSEFTINEQKYIQAFLARYWDKTLYEMSKLKTEKGKSNRKEKFYSNLKPYENRFSNETVNMILNSRFETIDANYIYSYLNKTDKDQYFVFETERLIRIFSPTMIEYRSGCNIEDYKFYVNNHDFLNKLIGQHIRHEIFEKLCQLYFIYEDHRKIERYLTIKFDIERWLAKLLSLSLNRIMCDHRDYRKLKKYYEESPNFHDKYIILTHAAPCEECQKHRGKVYNINDAQIGVNFPPFCSHGCSSAHLHFDKPSSVTQEPLSYTDKLFAKAVHLYMDGKYEQAAEYGLKVCLLEPENERYIQNVPEMLAKANRYGEAVKILDNYITLTVNPNIIYIKRRDSYKNILNKKSHSVSGRREVKY